MFVHTNDTDDTDEQVKLGNYRVRTCARTRGFSENTRIICIICYVPVVNTGCQLRHQLLLHRGVRLLPVLLPFLRSSFRPCIRRFRYRFRFSLQRYKNFSAFTTHRGTTRGYYGFL